VAGSSLPMKPNAAGANLRVFHILKNILQNTALEVNALQKFGRKYQLQKMGNRHVFQPSTKKPPRVTSVALFIWLLTIFLPPLSLKQDLPYCANT
jgi:hypothetical protein